MFNAAVRCSGSSARRAATSATRASRRGISTVGLHCSAARSASAKKGSTTLGLCSIVSSDSRQSSRSPVDSSPLSSMSQRGADREGPVDRLRERSRVGEQHLQRRLVGAHRRERQVAVVEQVQIGHRQVEQVRRGAGGLDPDVAHPLEPRDAPGVGADPQRVHARLTAVRAGREQRGPDQADRVGAGAVQPGAGPRRQVPVGGVADRPHQVRQLCVAPRVLREVAAQPLDELLLGHQRHQLVQDRLALVVGDRVEVREGVVHVGHGGRESGGWPAPGPAGRRRSARPRGRWPSRR